MVYTLKDIIDFGKYKGKTVEHVLKKDFSYLEWAAGKKILTLSPDVLLQLEKEISSEYDDDHWLGSCQWAWENGYA